MITEVKSLLETQNRDLQDFIKTAGGDIKDFKEQLEQKDQRLELRMDNLEALLHKPRGSDGSYGAHETKSVGERFIESEFVRSAAPAVNTKGQWRQGELFREFVGNIWLQHKATITTGNVGAGVIDQSRRPGIVPLAEKPLRIRDLMISLPTTGNVVQYIRENSFINGASPQVEGLAKAESSLDFAVVNSNIRTLPTWIPATKQVLDDFEMLESYINNRLLYGLKLTEEGEILSGDGTGEHLYGLIPQSVAFNTTLLAGGDTPIDRIRKAILQAELLDEMVDGVVINPLDYAKMELEKDTENRYIIGTPTGAIRFQTLWNKPVVSSRSIAAGTFLVGAFGSAAHLHDRQDATIDVSNSHADFFIKNMIAIRCEERIGLTCERSNGFIYGAF